MTTSFLTDMLARHAAEIEAEIELRTMNILEELKGIKQLGAIKASRKTAPSTKGAKRSPEALQALTDDLYRYVSKHPGQRIEQISAGMGVTTKELNLPVKKLIGDKLISTKGQKRATSYTAKASRS